MIDLPPAPAWTTDAACRNTDSPAFFPEGHSAGLDAAAAKRVCANCPIQAIIGCARTVVELNKRYRVTGVWAGRYLSHNSQSREGALKEIYAIAGEPYAPPSADENWPRPCIKCNRKMRQRNTSAARHPDTVKHRGGELCDTCFKAKVTGIEPGTLLKAVAS